MKIMNVKSVARHLVKNAIACTLMIALVFTIAPAESYAASKVPAQPKITSAKSIDYNSVQIQWSNR